MNKVIKRGVITAFAACMVAASVLGYKAFYNISEASVVTDETGEVVRLNIVASGAVDNSESVDDQENNADENSVDGTVDDLENADNQENQKNPVEVEPQIIIENEDELKGIAKNLIKSAYKGDYKVILKAYKKGELPSDYKGKKDDEILKFIEQECKYDIVYKDKSIKKLIGMENHNVKFDLMYEEFNGIESMEIKPSTEEPNDKYVINCYAKGKYRVSQFLITTDHDGRLHKFECKTYKPKAVGSDDYDEENIEIVYANNKDMKIQALLTLPKKVKKPPVAVLVEGSGYSNADNQYMNTRLFADIAHELAKQGIATLRYDERYFRDPKLAESNSNIYTACIDDVCTIVNSLKMSNKIDSKAIYLIVRNRGSVLAPRIKQKCPRIKGVIFLGGISRSISEFVLDEAQNLKDAFDNATEEEKKSFLEYYGVKENEAKNQLKKNLDDAYKITKIKKNKDEMLLGYTLSYWKSCNELKSKEIVRRQSYPMFFLQSDCDLHIPTSSDYRVFKTMLAGESCAYFKLYSGLAHNFTNIKTDSLLVEQKKLETSAALEEIVVDDMVGFIKKISRGKYWNTY